MLQSAEKTRKSLRHKDLRGFKIFLMLQLCYNGIGGCCHIPLVVLQLYYSFPEKEVHAVNEGKIVYKQATLVEWANMGSIY